MPAPIKPDSRYMPGLDGLRAIAVIAVVAYHLGAGWAPGGLLGVGVFFTLSGYLITDLLLAQVDRGGIRLKSFWFARARRLLPGLVLMLVVVMAWVTVIGPHQGPDFNDATASALLYFNNWWLIFHDVSYFAEFGAQTPLNHLWSLSVEEQFYIFWPLLLAAGVRLVPEPGRSLGVRSRLAILTLGLALASAIAMAVLYTPGIDPSRVYYGTDTRIFEILIGAALAMVWPSRRLQAQIKPQARRLIDGLGVAGLAVIVLMIARTGQFSPFIYRGGLVLLGLATALLVAALAHPASRLGPILGVAPLRWVGERSYGIYLWQLPIIALTTPEGAEGTDAVRTLAQIAAILAVSALSWKYVEDPIRHGALRRLWDRLRSGELRPESITPGGRLALGASCAVLLAAFLGLAGIGADPSKEVTVGEVQVAQTVTADAEQATDASACKSVVHIGDSTSEGLVSSEYLPDPDKQVAAQYARVGARTAHLEVSGARSIYETFEGQPNAYDVAAAWQQDGFDGCWVFALGTNEAANVAAGSKYTFKQRIDRMMSIAAGDPVLWVNVRSLETSGPYAQEHMEAWDRALLAACAGYPNMRVYDWSADVKDSWFIDDGIHFTTPGYAARGRLIANALKAAFPAGAPTDRPPGESCVVDPPNPYEAHVASAAPEDAAADPLASG